MGKKTKVGKQRKDKFYHLAKETGYRSRAAFKLIQLNRKFEFLQKSRVLVDLCAAPGGWMQVAVQHMPVSSIVIGVDLFPIKPVAGTIALQEDITSPRCLTLIKKELKTWKVDVVLNDGAPNVGQNWIHDAYAQNCLTLSAFKLATEILRPGGYFVTKVFRSKDYNSLVWVLQQFFKNVFSTKPPASRLESAEIFVVCKGYLAPHKIDPKFLDIKYVFDEIDVPEGKKQLQQLLQEVGKKKKAEGYPTGETLLYKPVNATEFIRSLDHIELLANTSQIILDTEWITNNALTTPDIKDYCSDVKVLGKKEIKALVEWRKKLRDKIDQFVKIKSTEAGTDNGEGVNEEEWEQIEDEDEAKDTIEEDIKSIKEGQRKEAKKKKKKLLKERRKIHEKTNLKMIIPGDVGPTDTTEDSLFTLKALKRDQDVHNLTDGSAMPIVEDKELDSDEELELFEEKQRSRIVKFDKDEETVDSRGRYCMGDVGEDTENESEDDDDQVLNRGLALENEDDEDIETKPEFDIDEVAPVLSNPLITDLDHSDKNAKRLRKAELWFAKDAFKDLDDESDEDIELSRMAEVYKQKGAKVIGFNDSDKELKTKPIKTGKIEMKKRKLEVDKKGMEVVSTEPKKKKRKLNIEGLALGTMMVQSNKTKRDLIDDGWNRFAFNDTKLPSWFLDDEKKHMRKKLPVPDSLVDEYKKNLQEINTRPIKKVVEAKARKKKRTIKKLEKAKKRAESILDKTDVSESEKASQLKQLYKKAKMTKKKEVTYVVAKKFSTSKRAKRPPGVKGHYKVVDPRMKKDMKKMKTIGKQNNSKGKKGGKGSMGRKRPR